MSAQRADDALHPGFPPGDPIFVPSFSPPAELANLSPPRQFAILRRDAARPDARAKLLYGVALQRLGRRLSARREYEEAARLDPGNPETQVAAAVSRFDKTNPSAAFSRLGPLAKRYPRASTVRFHLGLMLLWLARAQPGALAQGKRQLRLAQREEPGSPLAREAKRLLAGLEGV
jgi:tetratricopeptide (TPR) repeat protein